MDYDPKCRLCPLYAGAKSVCVPGEGPADADIMFVGRNPGYREDAENRPFVGPAGEFLRESLARSGLREDEVFLANVVKCVTPENRKPTREELAACAPYLKAELERVKPRYIFVFGNEALGFFTGKEHGKKGKNGGPGITSLQGQVMEMDGYTLFPMPHPSYVIRQGGPDDHKGAQIIRQKFHSTMTQHVQRIRQLESPEGATATEPTVIICRDMDMVRAAFTRLNECEVIAFDLETQGLWPGSNRRLHIVCLSGDGQTGYVIPLQHPETPDELKENMAWIRAQLSSLLTTKKTVAQYGQFDMLWLRARGVDCHLTFDTKHACHLLDENVSSALKGRINEDGQPSAPGQCEMYLGVPTGYSLDMSRSETEPERWPLEDLGLYGGKDACYTWRLREFHLERLKKDMRLARLYRHVIMPGTELFTQLTINGLPIDWKELEDSKDATDARVKEIEAEFDVFMAGCGAWDCDGTKCVPEWDWDSDDFGLMLYDVLGFEAPKRTKKTHLGSTNDESMKDLLAELHERKGLLAEMPEGEDTAAETANLDEGIRIVELAQEYGDLRKDQGFFTQWLAARREDGRIHPSYYWETVTGRTSSREPNAQQWPRDLRRLVRAREGYDILSFDYSQIELRLIAEDSQDPVMLKIFAEGGDIHSLNALMAIGQADELLDDLRAGRPIDWPALKAGVSKADRQKGKAISFGYPYGMLARKFQFYARYQYGAFFTLAEAEAVRKLFFQTYVGLEPWQKRRKRECHDTGQTRSFMGRLRRPDKIYSPNREERSAAERQAVNAPIQGGGSDLTILAGTLIPAGGDELISTAFVHDSFLYEVRKDVTEKWVDIVRETAENRVVEALKEKLGVTLSIPLKVDISVGATWAFDE